MNQNIIDRGAEAILVQTTPTTLTKDRIKKSYRFPELDERIRKLRTRKEAKLLEKAGKIIPTPKILDSNDKTKKIEMEFIKGKKLSQHLEKLTSPSWKVICKTIGTQIAKLHDAGIIHGDLTTSNMILKERVESSKPAGGRAGRSSSAKLYFIDFGLGFHSDKKEDKAVDLHLIKQALEAKHHTIHTEAFNKILEGYKTSKHHKETLKQLEKVEKRGRYKAQY